MSASLTFVCVLPHLQWSFNSISEWFQVCDVSSSPDNWLSSDAIPLNSAMGINIDLTFILSNCSRFNPKPPSCIQTFDVYLRTADSDRGQNPPTGYHKIQTVIGKKLYDGTGVEPINTATLTADTTNKGSYAFISFRDQGACIVLQSVKVSYYVCPSTTESLKNLIRTVSPFATSNSTKVAGTCVSNSVDSNGLGGFALCKSNGTWDTTNLKPCECKGGFMPSGDKCEGEKCWQCTWQFAIPNHHPRSSLNSLAAAPSISWGVQNFVETSQCHSAEAIVHTALYPSFSRSQTKTRDIAVPIRRHDYRVATFAWGLICVPVGTSCLFLKALYRNLCATYCARSAGLWLGNKTWGSICDSQATLSEKGFLINSGNQRTRVHTIAVSGPRRELISEREGLNGEEAVGSNCMMSTCKKSCSSGTRFRRLVMIQFTKLMGL